jgi:hypothetical protein
VLTYQQVMEAGRASASTAPRAVPRPTDVAVIMCGASQNREDICVF